MKLIKEENIETMYTIEFTKSELNTIMVAVGDIHFAKISEIAKNEYCKYPMKVAESNELYSDLLRILEVSLV
ncbi:MAG TPA: hypothetical protein VIM42_11400 [Clostridium sp.]